MGHSLEIPGSDHPEFGSRDLSKIALQVGALDIARKNIPPRRRPEVVSHHFYVLVQTLLPGIMSAQELNNGRNNSENGAIIKPEQEKLYEYLYQLFATPNDSDVHSHDGVLRYHGRNSHEAEIIEIASGGYIQRTREHTLAGNSIGYGSEPPLVRKFSQAVLESGKGDPLSIHFEERDIQEKPGQFYNNLTGQHWLQYRQVVEAAHASIHKAEATGADPQVIANMIYVLSDKIRRFDHTRINEDVAAA